MIRTQEMCAALQAYGAPQHMSQPASLLDADAAPRPPAGPPHLLEQLQPNPQLELQLGPQEVQVRRLPRRLSQLTGTIWPPFQSVLT